MTSIKIKLAGSSTPQTVRELFCCSANLMITLPLDRILEHHCLMILIFKMTDVQIFCKGNLLKFGNLHFMVFNKLCTDVCMQNKIDTCEIERNQVPKIFTAPFCVSDQLLNSQKIKCMHRKKGDETNFCKQQQVIYVNILRSEYYCFSYKQVAVLVLHQ